MRVGSLCSGYDGIWLAVTRLWPEATLAWQAEIDPFANAVLAARFPGVPNHGNLHFIDWDEVEPVEVLTAGYPCQPFSVAGQRDGARGYAHLWPQVLRAIRGLRPRLVLLENVAGHLSLGFDTVLADLAEAGFDANWGCLRASNVGGCHRRERLFVAAFPPTDPDGGLQGIPEPAHDTPQALGTEPVGRGGELAGFEFGDYSPAIDHWADRFRPAPRGLGDDDQLNARFVEWMMGLPEGWVTDIVPQRHALRILGNGVMPQQAAAAFAALVRDV